MLEVVYNPFLLVSNSDAFCSIHVAHQIAEITNKKIIISKMRVTIIVAAQGSPVIRNEFVRMLISEVIQSTSP